jgi:hypothetical protein
MISSAQQSLINAQMAPAQIGQEISSAIAAKTLNAAKQEGANVLSLLDSAAQVGKAAGPGDPLVAKATGLGSLIDVTG